MEGNFKLGNDLIAVEGRGTAGIGYKVKYGSEEKLEATAVTAGGAISRARRGFYGTGELKITSNVLKGIDYLKDEGENSKINKDEKIEPK